MQNNECSYISEQFTEYQDNSLSSEIRAQVDAHLTVCSSCQILYQDLDQVIDQLHKLPQLKTEADFTQRLMHEVEQLNQESFWHKLYGSSYTRIAGTAIAAGLIVALGLNLWIDPITPLSSQRERNFTGTQKTQQQQVGSVADQLDSSQANRSDSLKLNKTTINSSVSSLQLVSGKK
jgi:anti-sigma factor RsiW